MHAAHTYDDACKRFIFYTLFYKLFVQLLRMRHEHHPRLCSNHFLLNLNNDTVNVIVHGYAHYEHANRGINGHCIFNVFYECNINLKMLRIVILLVTYVHV